MPRFTIGPNQYRWTEPDKKGMHWRLLSKTEFDRFNLDLLGLGDVLARATTVDALAAIFDLQGFTNFSKQIEPHLAVPAYLNAFLTWLMETLRSEMRQHDTADDVALWCPLPFFVKYLGDGVLILWDASATSEIGRQNIVVSARAICEAYRKKFLSSIKGKFVEPPPILRCGLARGTVLSIGEGKDYVGSCINMAARIQKLPGTTFALNVRGFDLNEESVTFFTNELVRKEIAIRGIGDHELVCILRSEADSLSPKDKKFYKDP